MEKIWSMLLHFGTNMWNEEGNTRGREACPGAVASGTLRFSHELFRDVAASARDNGVNTLILDIGEAMKYDSHPELAVAGSWSKDEVRAEVDWLKAQGFEVVPKLNFSACHDLWLGEYSRMLSTSVYYRVCADVISEVCEVFKPKYFHLGMDEETADIQRDYEYCVIRQFDLWWHDLYYFINCVEKANARPWIWSDYMWDYPEKFLEKCPKSVIQSNWYYDADFVGNSDFARKVLKSFDLLEKHGFDQVPAGSNWGCDENMLGLTKFCAEHIADERLLGFMHAPWFMTWEFDETGETRRRLINGTKQLGESKKWFEER